jgi:DMSO reductase anchor subunit
MAGPRGVLAGLAALGAVMLIVSGFLPLYRITTEIATLRSTTGFEHHSITMLLLGLAAVPMILGAMRGAKPAMFALAAIGIVALVIAVTVDLPAALDEGLLAETYEGASAEPAIGFFVESAAGVLLLLSGGLSLLMGLGRPGASADAA